VIAARVLEYICFSGQVQ